MNARTLALAAAVVYSTALIACGGDVAEDSSPEETSEPVATETTPSGDAEAEADPRVVEVEMRDVPWAVALDVNLDEMVEQQSGLYTQVLASGVGPRSQPGDSMWVHYRVWLPNGSQLDASYDHDPPEPLAMQLGVTQLIEGWSEGVTGMRAGERRRLLVPYDLAYGPAGRTGVPPYSPLLFEVELLILRIAAPVDPGNP